MTTSSKNRRDDYDRLFARVREGIASAEEFEQLDLLLGSDSRARQAWLEFTGVESGVRQKLVEGGAGLLVDMDRVFAAPPVDAGEERVTLASAAPPAQPRRSVWSLATRSGRKVIELIGRYPVISCLIAAVVVTTVIVTMSLVQPPGPAKISTGGGAGYTFVARLTGTEGAQWSGNPIGVTQGAYLPLNHEMRLASGLVEVTFQSGAKLVLEGPCELKITSANGARLKGGKLAAVVPAPAVGFAVETPHGMIKDLGTEFAVRVDAKDGLDVHCFRGAIEFHPHGLDSLELAAGEAAVHRGAGLPVNLQAADASQFSRELRLRSELARDKNGLVVDRRFADNVAARATVTQSSTYNSSMEAAKALDGDRETFTHTSGREREPWLMVDLGALHDIDVIVLHNRLSCCGERLRDIHVDILAEDGETVVFTSRKLNDGDRLKSPELLIVGLPEQTGAKVCGRFVRVRRVGGELETHDQRTLSLAEVQVFADLVKDEDQASAPAEANAAPPAPQ